MTIAKGQAWGEEVARPEHLVTAHTDAELAALVTADPEVVVTVTGGDLHRALGAPIGRDPLMRLPIDACSVTVDGREVLAVSHVVARGSWWRGPIVAVVNAGPIGAWNVAPRAHPNDGRLDIVEVDAGMPARQRWAARRRLPLGTHVPHPAITVRTATEASWRFPRPVRIVVDGVDIGPAGELRVVVRPDHFAIHA